MAFSDGMRFLITCKGFWRPIWTVRAENSETVLQLHTREKAVQVESTVQLPEARLTLLAIFTWHIMRQAAEEAASTAGAVAVIS